MNSLWDYICIVSQQQMCIMTGLTGIQRHASELYIGKLCFTSLSLYVV